MSGLGPNVSGATRFESIKVVCAARACIDLSDCADLNRIDAPCVVIYTARAANLCPIDLKYQSPVICTRNGRGAPVQFEEVGSITNICPAAICPAIAVVTCRSTKLIVPFRAA